MIINVDSMKMITGTIFIENMRIKDGLKWLKKNIYYVDTWFQFFVCFL